MAPPSKRPAAGTETVLVVEDHAQLRKLVRLILSAAGYEVLVADGPEQAIRAATEAAKNIDLLITDFVLPGMNGQQLAEKVVAVRPEASVLFMSGYSDDKLAKLENEGSVHFLQKPIVPEGLLRAVRDILDRKKEG